MEVSDDCYFFDIVANKDDSQEENLSKLELYILHN